MQDKMGLSLSLYYEFKNALFSLKKKKEKEEEHLCILERKRVTGYIK